MSQNSQNYRIKSEFAKCKFKKKLKTNKKSKSHTREKIQAAVDFSKATFNDK